MASTWRRLAVTLTTVTAIAASLLVAPGHAWAKENPAEPVDRAQVLRMWRTGGVLVAPAAEQALLGTDSDVRAFLDRVTTLQDVDDRIAVNRILSAGGEAVRGQAQRALDAGTLGEFLSSGWQEATHVDQRVRVNQMMAAGGTQLRAAAQKALDADAANPPDVYDMDETPSGPLDVFVASGWRAPFETDQRIKVNQVLNRAPVKSNVRRLAQRALDADSLEALTSFLETGHAIGAARDEEASTIVDLVRAAERAGAEAEQLTASAKEEGAKATAAAAAARTSAQAALAAMKSAGRNAKEAANAAHRAADAAAQAAKAAVQAIAAAQAAVAASRVAARCAARAAAVAALTRQAANRANKAAADAAVNKDNSKTATDLAKAATDTVNQAKDAATAVAKMETVTNEAIKVAQAATDARTNSDLAVTAAEQALALARETGVNVDQAMAAAQRARNQAARANRASAAAIAFARATVTAAGSARIAATRAAEDAKDAAKAANDAVAHAGDATRAENASTNAANAATRAANDAVTAANDAYKVYEAARAVDTQRLAVAAEVGADGAKAELAAYEKYQQKVAWDAQEAVKRDAETNRLIAEVRKPAAERAAAVTQARRVALTLSRTAGPYTQGEALTALGGSDDDVLGFVRTGLEPAAAQDDRATVTTLARTGTQGLQAAADAALAGPDAAVAQFLRDQSYPERGMEDRVAVNRILAAARNADNQVTVEQAQRALDGDDQALRAFVTTGQFAAAYTDERVKANRFLSNEESGPELRAASQNALDGPPGALHEFVTIGWHVAAQEDHDAQVHDREMLALLSRAANAAATATQNSEEAQAVAATARRKGQESREWAAKAVKSAERAVGYANDAKTSAEEAEKSAVKAVESSRAAARAAQTANNAAERATRSAAAAQESYRQAKADANRASEAAERAKASALAAGKNEDEARGYYDAAYKRTNELIDTENREQQQIRQQQYRNCLRNTLPIEELQNKCSKVLFDPDSTALGKATLNKEFCNKFAQTGSHYYQSCVADTFNPNFMLNHSFDVLLAGAAVFAQWGTFTMAGIGVAVLTLACLNLCGVALGVLGGAEVSMGVSGLHAAWAEGAAIGYVSGGIGAGFAGARLLAELKGALGKIRIPGILQRFTIPAKATDANLARLVAKLPNCLKGPSRSLAQGSRVPLSSRASKAIGVAGRVLVTNPESETAEPQRVTGLIAGMGDKTLIGVTINRDGKEGDYTPSITAYDHPFWVSNQNARADSADLVPGPWLRSSAGTWVQVTALEHEAEHATLRNPAIDHMFYVLDRRSSARVPNAEPCDVALGYQKYGVRSWANRNGYKHFLDMPYPDWMGPVRASIKDEDQILRVYMNGFEPMNGTAWDKFLAMAFSGVQPKHEATQREMAWIVKAFYEKDRKSWKNIKFYDNNGKEVPEFPQTDWWNLVKNFAKKPTNDQEREKFAELDSHFQRFLDYDRWERENP
jgi:hypothetical protein